MSVCLLGMTWYQAYYNYSTNRLIDESIKNNNKQISRYMEINNQLRLENNGLKHDLLHSQAMYHALKLKNQ